MGMYEWADNEVTIACKRENPDYIRGESEFDYGCACYESALKAYKSLCEDNHSGMSFRFTQNILNRMMDDYPLTAITGNDSEWNDISSWQGEDRRYLTYQNNRMSSLFKYVYEDGTTKYNDVNRCYCTYNNDRDITFSSSLVTRMINEMFPIEMPYYPSRNSKIKVVIEEFLTDKSHGDFDTEGILYCKKGDEKININRYYKENESGEFVEIKKFEYNRRKRKADKLQSQIEAERSKAKMENE